MLIDCSLRSKLFTPNRLIAVVDMAGLGCLHGYRMGGELDTGMEGLRKGRGEVALLSLPMDGAPVQLLPSTNPPIKPVLQTVLCHCHHYGLLLYMTWSGHSLKIREG
ncbi:hypothetical protein RRG08_049622 [Elysia crispata]|uniref:Uncharacterized protein n=1 Tax=Elysia crispata TaxID=231223 RepID=A0AAE1E4Z3_9GAST|nr:hypothetical protein RRG08_049622 [Elysia crispata]